MYAYHRTEPRVWTVYDGDPSNTVSDHPTEVEARDETILLNGGTPANATAELDRDVSELRDRVTALENLVETLSGRLAEVESRIAGGDIGI